MQIRFSDLIRAAGQPAAGRVAVGLLAVAGLSATASAATQVVNGFGVGGWTSWDTRDTSGNQLVGTNDTNSYGPTYFGKAASTGDDSAIAQQIIFMGEGQTVNDNGDVGNPPAASPSGSLGGLGYVRLDGTGSNSGKSDISYVNTSGIATGGSLLDPSFGLSYRYYIDPETTSRTLGLNISLVGSDSNKYTLAYVQPSAITSAWNSASVDSGSGLFTLFENGVGGAESGAAKTLSDWSADPTYGTDVFGSGSEIYRVGFNIGSGQRNATNYLDWMQTNLLNGGDTIDFQAAPTPEPASLGLLGLGAIGLLRRRRVSSK